MFNRLTHVGIAVRNLEDASKAFARLFAARPSAPEAVESQHVRVTTIRVGETSVELLEPTSAASTVAKFIERRGEGVHHLSFEVDDIASEIERLKRDGFRLVDDVPKPGAGGCRVAFLHPKSTGGVLVEIVQKKVRSEERRVKREE